MGVGVSPSRTIEPAIKEEIARTRVNEISEKYGLDLDGELDDIDTGYLDGAIARTVSDRDGVSVVFDENDFFDKSKTEQELTTLHELLHVKQFNNSLGDWAQNERGASREFANELDTGYKTVGDLEGEVESITGEVFPYSLPSAYPYQKAKKQQEFEQKGFDLQDELFEDAKQEVENSYELPGAEIYDFAIEDGFYYETGSIGGFEYEFMAVGDKMGLYGPELAESYREWISDYVKPEKDQGDTEYLEGYDTITEITGSIMPKTISPTQSLDGNNYAGA